MKNIRNKAFLLLLSGSVLIASCDKDDDGELTGPLPTAGFTASAPASVGLTSEVTFTSTSENAFLYKWDFGDGTVGTGQTITHKYQKGGTVKVQLTAAGPRGYTVSEAKDVVLPEVLDLVKKFLTNGTLRTWKLDNSVVAPITVGPSDADPTSYYAGNPTAGALPACQADDEFTFSNANVYTYDAKGQTLVAGAAGCSAPRNVTTPFTFGAATGAGVGQLTLTGATPQPFIGVTDAPNLVYRILSISNTNMVLRAGSTSAGLVFDMKLVVK